MASSRNLAATKLEPGGPHGTMIASASILSITSPPLGSARQAFPRSGGQPTTQATALAALTSTAGVPGSAAAGVAGVKAPQFVQCRGRGAQTSASELVLAIRLRQLCNGDGGTFPPGVIHLNGCWPRRTLSISEGRFLIQTGASPRPWVQKPHHGSNRLCD